MILHNTGVRFREYIPEHLGFKARGVELIPTPFSRFELHKKQLNQNAYDKGGCTYTAAMTQVDNNWYPQATSIWTQADIQWFLDNKYRYGWDGDGMYMDRADDMVIERLKIKYPGTNWDKKMLNFYTERKYYLDKGYMLQIGSFINQKYLDEVKDGAINAPWGKDGEGHVRSLFSHIAYVGEALVENYLGVLPHNVIDIVALKEIEDAKQFYYTSFIIYPTSKMPVPIPYPYMTPEQADALERKYPDLFTPDFSESVRAWVEAAQTGNMKYGFIVYKGIDGVMKMMIDLKEYREKLPLQ